MIAAAFDERLMGAPAITGGGGMGAYRFAGPGGSESLDVMQMKYPNWFSPNLHEFWGQREKLPFDQHWFLALCAPRPFLALEGVADRISLPEAVRQIDHGRAAGLRVARREGQDRRQLRAARAHRDAGRLGGADGLLRRAPPRQADIPRVRPIPDRRRTRGGNRRGGEEVKRGVMSCEM